MVRSSRGLGVSRKPPQSARGRARCCRAVFRGCLADAPERRQRPSCAAGTGDGQRAWHRYGAGCARRFAGLRRAVVLDHGQSEPARRSVCAWIEVNVSQQTLYAYQGDTLITQTLVSTGLAPNTTELGVFHVRYKVPVTDMQGTTGPNGEVIAVGTEAQGGERYIVKDVPDVMYINADAEALHGTYWHNNFGYPMSHGCINLPLDMAHFLYGWAPLGTMVWVHE
ncbi:MAG: hypothetical protein C4345_07305 [Chloroflexota bacterium]